MIQPPDPNQPNVPEPTVYAPNNAFPFPTGPNPLNASYQSGGYPQPGYYSQPGYPGQPAPQRRRKRGWIIGMVALVVILISVGVVAFATHDFRQEPPSSWLSTQLTDSSNGSTFVEFITWNNQDGQLTGTLEAAYNSGITVSLPITGSYNYQNHSVTLIVHGNGQSTTATGTVDGDTMTLSTTDDSSTLNKTDTLVFHSATLQDFQNARN